MLKEAGSDTAVSRPEVLALVLGTLFIDLSRQISEKYVGLMMNYR